MKVEPTSRNHSERAGKAKHEIKDIESKRFNVQILFAAISLVVPGASFISPIYNAHTEDRLSRAKAIIADPGFEDRIKAFNPDLDQYLPFAINNHMSAALEGENDATLKLIGAYIVYGIGRAKGQLIVQFNLYEK
jgi:hypothetical protein